MTTYECKDLINYDNDYSERNLCNKKICRQRANQWQRPMIANSSRHPWG